MTLKALYNELRRMYYSFFRPPSVDIAVIRRERFSIAYAISSFTLFVVTSFMIFKQLEDPAVMEKATLKPPPGAKHLKVEFDAKKFTCNTETKKSEDVDQEKNSSLEIADQGENLTNEVLKNVSV